MNITMMLSLTSLFYVIVLMFLFFSKSNFKNNETKIYSILLFSVLFGIILELSMRLTASTIILIPLLNDGISKLFLFYTLFWFSLITLYNLFISFSEKTYKIIKYVVVAFNIIIDLIILFVPIEYFFVGNNDYYSYTYGAAVDVLYAGITIILISNILVMILKFKKVIRNKKYYPIIICILLFLISAIIQNTYPEVLLNMFIQSLITFIMYHTIENPDVQMINELYKNKTLVEKAYDDKSNFLFKMTQEVKTPIKNLKSIIKVLKEKNTTATDLKEGIKLIDSNTRQVDFIVNNLLNVTTLDSKNIKIMNNRYNIYNLLVDIEKRVKQYEKGKVEFRFNIDKNIPYLYGDTIKLKQIIMSVLLNSIEKTNKGFIELSINSIIKYDVCRLIITIEDSGIGMTLDKINDVLITTSELSVDDIKNLEKLDLNLKLCQKSINMLGGNLMIRSEVEKGTEVIIALDQKIYENDKSIETLDKYEKAFSSISNVLIVTEDEDVVSKIKKEINKKVIINNSLYALDAIGKIKSGKSYDLILMNDDVADMSGITALKEIRNIKNYKKPIVVMLEKDKEKIKEHYVKDGFTDYLLLENFNDEIKRIINKYL